MRVELNPGALFRYGIGLEDVRAALASANANAPKGAIDVGAGGTFIIGFLYTGEVQKRFSRARYGDAATRMMVLIA